MAEEQRQEHEPRHAQRRLFQRPPLDGTDEELEAWAEAFVNTALDEVKGS
jgi:hypothetical protein